MRVVVLFRLGLLEDVSVYSTTFRNQKCHELVLGALAVLLAVHFTSLHPLVQIALHGEKV